MKVAVVGGQARVVSGPCVPAHTRGDNGYFSVWGDVQIAQRAGEIGAASTYRLGSFAGVACVVNHHAKDGAKISVAGLLPAI